MTVRHEVAMEEIQRCQEVIDKKNVGSRSDQRLSMYNQSRDTLLKPR